LDFDSSLPCQFFVRRFMGHVTTGEPETLRLLSRQSQKFATIMNGSHF